MRPIIKAGSLSEKVRILFLQTSDSGGGSKRSLFEQVKVLREDKNFHVTVICTSRGWFSNACEREAIPYVFHRGLERFSSLNANLLRRQPLRFVVTFASHLSALIRLWHLIWRLQPNGIVLNESRDLPCVAPFCGSSSLVIQNSMVENEADSLHGWLASRLSDHIFCVAQPVVDGLMTSKHKWRLHLVPLIVEIPLASGMTSSIRKELRLPEKRHLIGVIGAIHPRKGQRDVLEAFFKIADRCTTHVILAGAVTSSNPEAEAYLREIRGYLSTHEAGKRVHLVGWREDVSLWLKEMSILVMPSTMEGLPRVAIEALMNGVPVVAYDIPSIAAMIESGKDGILVPAGNVDALAVAIESTLNDEARLCAMSVNARKSWEAAFEPTRLKALTARAFRSVFNLKTDNAA